MRRLRERYPNELVVIGVHSAKFPSEKLTENIRQAVMRHGIDHPVVNDAGFRIWNEYAVKAWPTLILIDPRMRIAGEISGEILADELAENIEEILREHGDLIDRRPFLAQPEQRLEISQPLRYPAKLLPAEDRLFIADSGHHRVLEMALDADGRGAQLVRVFGTGSPGLLDGPPGQARFNQPHGLSLLGSPAEGTLYVADTENHAVRAIHLSDGMVRTVAGTGEKAHGSYAVDIPTETPLRSPWAVQAIENIVFIAMAGSHQIWVLIDENRLGPFAGNGNEALVDGPAAESSFNQPSDLAYAFGHLFIADAEASAIRALTLYEAPRALTMVGQGLFDFGDVDGVASQVRLQHPTGLDITEADQKIYIADSYNHKIKTLDPQNGEVRTLIGTGQAGSEDGPFEQASLFEPEGLKIHGKLLYIADTNNHQVRVADLSTRELITMELRGVVAPPDGVADLAADTPIAEAAEGREFLRQEPMPLEPVQVGPGRVRLRFTPRLPEGYHLHPDQEPALSIAPEVGIPVTGAETAAKDLEIELDLREDSELLFDLTVYYCRDGDNGLCLIDDQRWMVPVQVVPGGPSRAAVPVKISSPDLPGPH